jgi:hypothetical protein
MKRTMVLFLVTLAALAALSATAFADSRPVIPMSTSTSAYTLR